MYRRNQHNLATRHRGYTLVELVLVMGLLCLVAGLASVTLRGFMTGRQAQDGAEEFVAVAQWARAKAVADGDVYRLNVDLSSRTYWLTVQRGGQFVSLGDEFGSTFSFPDNVGVDCDFRNQDGTLCVEFEPTGRTDEGNLRLIGSDGNVVQVGCMTTTDQFAVYPKGQQVAWGVHHGAKDIVGGANP